MNGAFRRALGVDVGTSALKAVRVRVDNGAVVVERAIERTYNDERIPTRDPAVWVAAAHVAVGELLTEAQVDVVGFTGQMHALVPVAKQRPIRPALLWLDYTGAAALERFCATHPKLDLLRRTGNIPLPDFTLAKWLVASENDSTLPQRVDRLPPAKDFVRDSFLDEPARVIDVNEAAGTQWFDPFERVWDREITRAAHLPDSVLGPVVSPHSVIASTAAGATGSRIPVVAGAGDQQSAARAFGADRPGTASLNLGTSGVLAVAGHLGKLPDDWDGGFHLFPLDLEGSFHVIGTIPALAGSLRWAAQLLGVAVADLGHLASAGRQDQVRFFPYLGGSGAPHPDASKTGELRGLTEMSTREDVARAVIDGIANEAACLVSEVLAKGVTVSEVVLSGGAVAQQGLAAAIASRLSVPVCRSTAAEASAIGAALYALDSLGVDPRPTSRREEVGVVKRIDASPRWLSERTEILSSVSTV
jgi:sugar (pentulose or hexulose) kinase